MLSLSAWVDSRAFCPAVDRSLWKKLSVDRELAPTKLTYFLFVEAGTLVFLVRHFPLCMSVMMNEWPDEQPQLLQRGCRRARADSSSNGADMYTRVQRS